MADDATPDVTPDVSAALARDAAAVGERVSAIESTRPSTARRVRSIAIRLVVTLVALGVSGFLLVAAFDDLDWSTIWTNVTSLEDAEMVALGAATALMFAAQGLVTASTVPGLPVRRGVVAYLGPASIASVVPGPSDLPVRYRMYSSWGYDPQAAGLAVVSSGIFSIGTKLVLPVLAALVAVLSGVELSDGIGGTIVAAGLVLGVLIVITGVVLGSPRLAHRVGTVLQAPWDLVTRMLRKQTDPLPVVLGSARRTALDLLADRWLIATWAAFLLSVSQLGLMLLAVRFTGVPESALGLTEIFVAYGIVQGLTVLPLTAGNVGVSETAWIGLMGAMAGGSYVNEVTAAVIIYRALTWLLVIPLGGIALAVWRAGVRRVARTRPEAVAAPETGT